MKVYVRKGKEEMGGLGPLDYKLASDLTAKGRRVCSRVRFMLTPAPSDFLDSDHISFWRKGMGVVTFSQNREEDLNPRINTKDDFLETLNFETLHCSFQYIAGAVIEWSFGVNK